MPLRNDSPAYAEPRSVDRNPLSHNQKKSVDLFQKCWSFTRADEIKAQGYYPYFRPIEENEGPVVMIEGRKMIMA